MKFDPLAAFWRRAAQAPEWVRVGVLAAAYFATAKLGLRFAEVHGNVSPFWPASGLAIAAIVLGGPKFWPGVALGAFLANVTTPVSPFAALGIAVGNTLEALAGAAIYRRVEKRSILEPFAEVSAWSLVALVAPLPGALIGLTALSLTGAAEPGQFAALVGIWWLGDGIGALVAGPAVCAVHAVLTRPMRVTIGAVLKALVLGMVAAAVCFWIFERTGGSLVLFLVFPVLLLAVWSFGDAGVHLACFGIAVFSVSSALDPSASLLPPRMRETVQQLDTFLVALGLTAHLLAVFHRTRCLALASAVLAVGWALGGWLFYVLQSERMRLDQFRFDSLVDEAQEMIQRRLDGYIDVLRGAASFFDASDQVTRDAWRRYVESADLAERFPGLLGMGLILPIREREVERFVEANRADGRPEFAIHAVPNGAAAPRDPAGSKHFVITLFEPEAPSRGVIGLDVGSEFNRHVAARVARDYGEPRMTRPVPLTGIDAGPTGFLLYVPIYQPGSRHETVHARRVAFRGWVYAPLVADKLLDGVLGKRENQIEFCLFDGRGTASARLLFCTMAGGPHAFARQTVVQLGGQQFTTGWLPGPRFQSSEQDPFLNAATLALVPALLSGLVVSLRITGRRARELADERTHELRNVNARLRLEIADRRRAESEARSAREAAESANAAKGEFLATMSHEIRTPMNGMIGYAELLAGSELSAEQAAWVRYIQSSGRTLLTIINDILDFSKVEAGQLQLERIGFDPLKAVQEVHDLMAEQARQKGLALTVDAAAACPTGVIGDPVRFKQVLTDLVSNAIKFTEVGSVRIGVEWTAGGRGGALHVSVADTGPGIPTEKRGLLFKKFSQLDSSTTRRFGGTGLGLAICKRLVELMDGSIGMRSALGAGTTFWFDIPFETCELAPLDPAERAPHAAGVAALAAAGFRVLLAEDLAVNRKLATTILGRLGCIVETAADGREAVRRALGTRYDVIFMDCQMPVMDGYQAAREIRNREAPGDRTPIIAVTANALDGDREKCVSAGMDDYISKPFSQQNFVCVLARWARPRRAPAADASAAIAKEGATKVS